VVAYIASLRHQLQRAGVSAPLSIMQSNGGIMAAAAVVERPAWIVESGPAAGLIAAQRLGQQAGWPDLISFDMGGTTAKAGLVEGGQLGRTTEYEVGAGISLSSRLIKGAGHALKLPVLDIAEVGAGGGSLVWLDRGGALKVGPQSAGAVPGPACYGRGGERPTVTDANVVLGYLNPQALAGGTVPIVAERARAALMTMIAAPLRLDLLTAAHGVHTLANATMIRAIKAVTTYRGRDPRDFNLLAFGGSGPVHAAAMAEELGLRRVIVPPAPGLFSAVGLLVAPPTRDLVQSFSGRTDILDPAALNAAYADLTAQAHALLTASPAPSPSTAAGPAATSDTTLALIESDLTRAAALVRPGGRHDPATTIMTERAADLRYAGQAYELTVSVPDGPLTSASLMALAEAFGREHQRTYGHRASDEPVELVNLRLTARLATAEQPLPRPVSVASQPIGQRAAFFGPPYGRLSTPILQRGHLEATPRPGPLIVEEYDATTVVPPGWQARRDRWDTIVLEHGSR
jgi:N-methylhydantoinase A